MGPAPEGILEAGANAPPFRLRNLAGGETALADLLPRAPLLLAFFKVACPVCQLTLPFLDRIHREAAGSLTVCGISQDEAEGTRDFNRRYGVTFPVLLDTDANRYQASNAFGLSTVPSLFLVDAGGRIVWSGEGFRKLNIEMLATRAGVNPFRPGDYVPEWKAG